LCSKHCFVELLSSCIKFSKTDLHKITATMFHETQLLCFDYYFQTLKVTLLGLRNRVSWQTVSFASTEMSGLIKPVHDGGGGTSLHGWCCHLSGRCCTSVDYRVLGACNVFFSLSVFCLMGNVRNVASNIHADKSNNMIF